jgi:RecA/RadA recombinase
MTARSTNRNRIVAAIEDDDEDEEDVAAPVRQPPKRQRRPINPSASDDDADAKPAKGKARTKKGSDPKAFLSDTLIDAIVAKVAQETGSDDIVSADDMDKRIVGIPFPSFALSYLFGMTVWVLGRITELFGQEGSCKSSFLFEIMRWHAAQEALITLVENENKDAAILMKSLLANPRFAKRVKSHPTNSLQDWQKAITFWTNQITDVQAKHGKLFPYCLGLDSLTATADEETIDKINSTGNADRGFAIEAYKISKYCKTLPDRMRQKPWSFIATNHLKPGTDAAGRPQDNVPGGKAMKFMASLRVKMVRVKDVDTNQFGGVRIKFQIIKNSLAPSKRSIEAEMKWRSYEYSPGVFRQQTYWDWDQATIDILLHTQTFNKTLWKQIQDVVDLHPANQKTIWSKALGIPKTHPVKYSVAGNMLENRPDLLDQLYPLFMISRYCPYEPGVDFDKMLKRLEKGRNKPYYMAETDRALVGNSSVADNFEGDVDAAMDAVPNRQVSEAELKDYSD